MHIIGETGPAPHTLSNVERRRNIARWVAREVMPHEAGVRAFLYHSRLSTDDMDEVIQDAYCRLSMLDTVDHIECPRAYFHSIARNLMLRRLKRRQIVPIELIAELESFVDDQRPSPEQETAGRIEYARVQAFMATLPERCRMVVQLRKIEGWPQKRIAEHLGISEKAVEKLVWLGVKAIREAWSEADRAGAAILRQRSTDKKYRP